MCIENKNILEEVILEKGFHRIREAFYIDEDFKSVTWINTEMGHEEYFYWIQHPEYIEEKVRGYILNNHIVLYIGKDFRVPMTINIGEIFDLIKIFKRTQIEWIGLGCIEGKIGEEWKPQIKIELNKDVYRKR